MVPEFEGAVQSLEVGELTSEPVQSDHGFHVIRRLELEEDYAPLEEQRDALERSILDGYMNDSEFMAEMVTELSKEANVQITDQDLAGAMAAYMPQEDLPIEEDTEDAEGIEETEEDADAETEEPVEEPTEEESTEDEQ